MIALVMGLGLGGVPGKAEAAAALTLKANKSSWTKIGRSRLTSLADVTIKTPATPIEAGVQFRAKAKSSGYRAKIKIAANGAVTAVFARVKSSKQTSVGKAESLGFSVKPGESIRLQATVTSKKRVQLYLRAWKVGTTQPSGWQLTATDSSGKRVKKAGATYLWARTPSGSPKLRLAYNVKAVSPYSAAKAAAVGLHKPEPAPKKPAPTPTPTLSSAPSPKPSTSSTPTPTPTTSPTATPEPTTSPTLTPSQSPAPQPSMSQLPDSADTFSIAVIGDTQNEVLSSNDGRFGQRTAWLAANKNALDLRYVVHTGDVVNWGWLDPDQYTRARNAMAKLTYAGIPWSVAIGNHDTRAVGWNNVAGSTGYGGAAYANNPECTTRLSAAECDSSKLVRETGEFNDSFPSGNLTDLGGTFEDGKIDNAWTTFTANGTKWLVLNIEFAPRKTAVEWARGVVAAHPDYNVIIDTHFYLTGTADITTSNAGYGETSGKYIYDEIVSKYANVKIVLSGHTGAYTSRTDTNNGNTTVSYLGNDLGGGNNPVRILTIDTASGKVTSTVYSKIQPGSAAINSTGTATISVIK